MEYKKRSVKRKILLSLLNGEKSTGELAKDLGYVDKRGIPQYKNVEKQLNSLRKEQLVGGKKKRGTVGAPRTYWRITSLFKAVERLLLSPDEIIQSNIYRQQIPQMGSEFKTKILDGTDDELSPEADEALIQYLQISPIFLSTVMRVISDEQSAKRMREMIAGIKPLAKEMLAGSFKINRKRIERAMKRFAPAIDVYYMVFTVYAFPDLFLDEIPGCEDAYLKAKALLIIYGACVVDTLVIAKSKIRARRF